MDDVTAPARTSLASLDATGPIHVQDPSGVGEARRVTERVAAAIELGEEERGRAAIVVTEIATNQVKHAGGGVLFVHPITDGARRGLLITAIDRGRGMDVAVAMRDGHSSAGTAGNGLGAIRRMADDVDIHSVAGHGTVVTARIGGSPSLLAATGLAMPLAGEHVCGDAWAVSHSGGYRTLLVADGLGHGPQAAEAARAAVEGFLRQPAAPIESLLRLLDGLLRPTRGAAVAIARVDHRDGSLRYGGVGNIAGFLTDGVQHRSLISHNGTLGHQARKFQEFTYSWTPASVLVLHSDGLSSQWKLDDVPGLRQRRAAVIAAVLVREFARGRDDATALVLTAAEADAA